jgi:hypothetical protein
MFYPDKVTNLLQTSPARKVKLVDTALTPLDDDQLRRVRINADAELSRRRPGWHMCIFHHAFYHPAENMYSMIYTLSMVEGGDVEFIHLQMGQVPMADGSFQWRACPVVLPVEVG